MALIATSKNNWGEFDGDLLNLILSNLFGKDRLSFGLVCRRWNEVSKTTPPSPCLMSYHRRTHTWKFNQHNTFFDDTNFPDLETSEVRCSKHGWLLMSRYDNDNTLFFFFFNPSNNQKVDLPPVVVDEEYEMHGCTATWTIMSFFNPPTSPECVVVGISARLRDVDVCTLVRGECEWKITVYEFDNSYYFPLSLGPPVLHGGVIYLLSMDGDVARLDFRKQDLYLHLECLKKPESEDQYHHNLKGVYLVKVKGEEDDQLFGVFVFGDEREVKVFRLSSLEMKWELMEEGIGDKVLYVSYTSCFGFKAPTKEMENTVCFPMFRGDVPVCYSLSDAEYRTIDGGDYSAGNAHGLRSLEFATWVMPMPAWEVDTNFVW